MSKKSHNFKQKGIIRDGKKAAAFEQHFSIDDSLLPEAKELAKLKEIDPNIVDWIKERAEKEQNARHEFNNRKISLIEKEAKRNFTVDIITILSAFFIIVLGMGFSYFLIMNKMEITGTIFAGATIVFAANAFLNYRKKHKTKDNSKTDKVSE